MNRKIAVLFAGQGAQSVGMGKDLAEKYPIAQSIFREADSLLGRELSRIMFEGPVEQLTRTGNCQPALFVHGIACLQVLRDLAGDFPIAVTAGLSLGEFTAHTIAGTFDFETGLRLVESRGRFMDEACDAVSGGMAALIGADETSARALASAVDVDVANLNCPGQVVLSGEASKISLAVGLAKDHGIRRATPLNVAGAYHSRLMQPAYEKLAPELLAAEIGIPHIPVLCNIDATVVSDADSIRRTLGEQVTGTVRWTGCMETMLNEFECDLFIECGPGKVLAGLMSRTNKDAQVLSVTDCESVEHAAEMLKSFA